MASGRRTNETDTAHMGPVVPPSLGEVYEISARRQRTRYRFIQGTLVAVAVAGVGIGIRTSSLDQGPELTQAPAATAEGESLDDAASSGGSNASDTVSDSDPDACFLDGQRSEETQPAQWIGDGRDAYLDRPQMTTDELQDLTDLWQIPFDETKALVGFATRNGVTLGAGSNDDALFAWGAQGYTGDQLSQIAEEWNTTTTAIKVLQFIGDSAIGDALETCGLTTVDG